MKAKAFGQKGGAKLHEFGPRDGLARIEFDATGKELLLHWVAYNPINSNGTYYIEICLNQGDVRRIVAEATKGLNPKRKAPRSVRK
jgi:hypothetical protein